MGSLNVALTPETEEFLRKESQLRGLPIDQVAASLLEKASREQSGHEAPIGSTGLSLVAMAEEARRSVPPAAWESLPPDFTERLDQYLYGPFERE